MKWGEGCGYESCSCRGVNFISRYREETDYCVNGKRVSIGDDGGAAYYSTNQSDLDAIDLFHLEQYAKYCYWHSKQKREKPDVYGDMVLQPFEHPFPVRLKAPKTPTLPTMENSPADRAAAAGEAQAVILGDRLRAPLPSISRTTGDIEKSSPLFRESSANPQQNLF